MTGEIIALMARIRLILKILEPTILPIAILFSFLIAAIIEVATSGKEVPNAKIPKPIIVSRIPKYLAKSIDPSVNSLAPKETPIKPMKKNINAFDKDKFCLLFSSTLFTSLNLII